MYGITKRNQTLAILGKSGFDRKTDFFKKTDLANEAANEAETFADDKKVTW